jgi:UDP-N-acetylmuramyl tripeptide synthase
VRWLWFLIASAISWISRLSGRGEGSTIAGATLLKLSPNIISKLASHRRVLLVSGTNGKTSTSKMIARAFGSQKVASNASGANLPAGIATALALAPRADFAILEVDELYLPQVLEQTRAEKVLLLNLSRDQLHRTQEVRIVCNRWKVAMQNSKIKPVIYIDAGDPFLASVVRDYPKVIRIGFGARYHPDAASCPECGVLINFEIPGFLFSCPGCKLGEESLDYEFTPREALARNAAIAEVVVQDFGIPHIEIGDPIDRVSAIEINGVKIAMKLVKNPASWQEGISALAPHDPVILIVNARGVDGLDTSWLWDVDFRALRSHKVFVTGDRYRDVAYRIHVDGVTLESAPSLEELTVKMSHAGISDASALASYTAFMEIASKVRVKK